MNTTEHTLTLIAEATAHGIQLQWAPRTITIFYPPGMRETCTPLIDELDAHANHIWATLYSHRQGCRLVPTPAHRERS